MTTEVQKEIQQPKKKRSLWATVWKNLKKNKMAMAGLVILVILALVAIFAPWVARQPYYSQDLLARNQTPNATYWFGADQLGRCIFSRIVYGSRVSLQVGFIVVGIAAFAGGFLGAIAAYYGGKLDNILMRILDILLATPGILLAISIVAALGPGLTNVMIAVGINAIPGYARVVRGSVMTVRDQEFIEAARAVGTGDSRIILKHIIPNAMAPVIVQATLGVGGAILAAAALSFIGLGLQPPIPEWGAMLSEGRPHIRDFPHLTTFPGLAIMITIFALNLFGDGLRDALDPRLKD